MDGQSWKHEIHILPMFDLVYDLMERRRPNKSSEFVFQLKVKPVISTNLKVVNRVVEWAGVTLTLYDLRRTFATFADSLHLPAYALIIKWIMMLSRVYHEGCRLEYMMRSS